MGVRAVILSDRDNAFGGPAIGTRQVDAESHLQREARPVLTGAENDRRKREIMIAAAR